MLQGDPRDLKPSSQKPLNHTRNHLIFLELVPSTQKPRIPENFQGVLGVAQGRQYSKLEFGWLSLLYSWLFYFYFYF